VLGGAYHLDPRGGPTRHGNLGPIASPGCATAFFTRERAQPAVGDAHHGKLPCASSVDVRPRGRQPRRGEVAEHRALVSHRAGHRHDRNGLIDSLPGYRGLMGPVRVGNARGGAAARERQLTGLDGADGRRRCSGTSACRARADLELYRQLCVVGNEAKRVALTPDAGLWEYPGSATESGTPFPRRCVGAAQQPAGA